MGTTSPAIFRQVAQPQPQTVDPAFYSAARLDMSGNFGAASAPGEYEKLLRAAELDKQIEQAMQDTNLAQRVMFGGADVMDMSNLSGNCALAGVAVIKAAEAASKEREKQKQKDWEILELIDNIRAIENELADKYGENYADDILNDLAEKALISDEELAKIRAITDDAERNAAIAELINQKRKNGEITDNDIIANNGDRLFIEWLNNREMLDNKYENAAVDLRSGNKDLEGFDPEIRNDVMEELYSQLKNEGKTAEEIDEIMDPIIASEEKIDMDNDDQPVSKLTSSLLAGL